MQPPNPLAEEFAIYHSQLIGTAYKITRNDEQAADIVQEAYAKALEKLESYRGEAKLSSWLTRIVINTALSLKRKEKRSPETYNDLDWMTGSGEDPQQIAEQREFMEDVKREARRLPIHYWTMLSLRYFDGHSNGEISDILGERRNCVKLVIHHARVHLREKLQKHDPQNHRKY